MPNTADRRPPGRHRAERQTSRFGTDAEREEIRRLVAKERVLRGVAELIARAGADDDIIAVIVREASRQVRGRPVTVAQFVGSRELRVLASPDGPAEAGMRIIFEADTLPDRVLRTGRPSRVDDYRTQPDAEMAARFGNAAGVAVPIVVEGRTWGMFFVSSTTGPLPPETETLLAAFAQLVITSFDSIEARDRLRAVKEHDETMRSIQHLAVGASLTDVARRLAEYAAKLPGIEHVTLSLLGGVSASASNPVVSIANSSIRPTQTVMFPVSVQQPLGQFMIRTTLAVLPAPTVHLLSDLSEVTGRIMLAITHRQRLSELIDEQASLRRIAELAARGVPRTGPTDDILAAICKAASDQLGGQEITLLQFESPDTIVAVATYAGPVPPGVRVVHPPGSLSDLVARTKASVRIDDFDALPSAAIVRKYGIRAGVGVPVFIEDRLWGAFVSTSAFGPLPHDTERKLEGFATLTWAAIANAEARESLRRLAEEQAALRHVAELVARESPLPAVFDAVVEEAARVLHASSAAVIRDHGAATPGVSVVSEVRGQTSPGAHRSEVPILVNGDKWGILTVSTDAPSQRDGPNRLKPFADLLAAAIANADHREGLTQSRARVIAAADEARRRLQRDVHDGAQQRLVHTILMLKLARDSARADGDVTDLLADALSNAEEANRQLRDTVRGILPAALTRSGLAAGVRALVVDAPIPVTIDIVVPRLATAIETTAYFTVAEAVTNAVKHARAARIGVSCTLHADELVVTIVDDGIGGADPAHGTGLTGLADRIEASEGTLTIDSPSGHGTRVIARIPIPPSL